MSGQILNSKQFSIDLDDGASIAITTRGKGPALLCISGLGGTANFWAPCTHVLADHFQTICLDQRGIAQSTRGTALCTIDQLAQDCFKVLDACGISSAVVLGHSTGGCIAQTMALAQPDRVRSLVLSGTWARPNRYMNELFKMRSALLENNPVAYATSAVFLSYESSWINANWSTYESAIAGAPVGLAAQLIIQERIQALMQFDRKNELPNLKMPSLILGARDDLLIPSFLQQELADAIPQSALHLLDHGGHFFPLTRQTQFTQRLAQWMNASA